VRSGGAGPSTVEDGPDVLPLGRELQSIGTGVNLLDDLEGTRSSFGELSGRAVYG